MSEKNRVKLMLILKRKIAKSTLRSRRLAGADTESSQLGHNKVQLQQYLQTREFWGLENDPKS